MAAQHINSSEKVLVLFISINSAMHTVPNLYLWTWYFTIIILAVYYVFLSTDIANNGCVHLGFLTCALEHGQHGFDVSSDIRFPKYVKWNPKLRPIHTKNNNYNNKYISAYINAW